MSDLNPHRRIYISGPMRGYDGSNFPAFFEAEEALRKVHAADAEIMNPARSDVEAFDLHEMMDLDPTGLEAGRALTGDFALSTTELQEALTRDLVFICNGCDLLVLLPGWEKSKGALAEKATAEALGIEIREFQGAHDGGYVWTSPEADTGVCETSEPSMAQLLTDAASASWRPVPAPHALRSGEEVRVTSETGGQKGSKLAAFDQISPEIEWLVAEHFGKGARKYDAHNFRRGYPWSLSYSALRRHLADFWAGKEYDVCLDGCEFYGEHGDEGHGPTCRNHTGSLHIVCAIWHTMVLTEFFLHRKEYDDRYVYETSS